MGTQTHLPPKFSVTSDFGHFILKMLKNAKFLICVKKKDTEISSVLGGGGCRPPLISGRERDARESIILVPPAFDAHDTES